MTLTELLTSDADEMYAVTAKLFKRVDEDKLDWKPATGYNWMTTGQLVLHCTEACGTNVRGFVTGDWDFPESMSPDDMPDEDMMPKAEAMPTVESIDEAVTALRSDRDLTMQHIDAAGEANLLSIIFAPPWGGLERTLFQHINQMIWHLGQHKGQLFYYLKLQGKDVNTMTLWMP